MPAYIHDDTQREFFLFAPPLHDPTEPTPLVFILHGGGAADATNMMGHDKDFMTELTRRGWLGVFPNGLTTAVSDTFEQWAVGEWANWIKEQTWMRPYDELDPDNPSEVRFFDGMINRIQRNYAVDPRRIYVAGYSNGGMMAYRLAQLRSETYAAIGSVAGAIGGFPGNVPGEGAHPVAVYEVHGELDPTVPPYGNNLFATVADAMEAWIDADDAVQIGGRLPPGLPADIEARVIESWYASGRAVPNDDVAGIIIEGQNHTWPGTWTANSLLTWMEQHPRP